MTPPPPARYAKAAAAAIGAVYEDLDEGRGYLYRVTRNNRSVLGGGGGVCAYPVNSAAAFTIARDKAHTKSVLRAAGLPCIPGGLFFSHKRRVSMRGPGRETVDAVAYASELGFPVFCKPNNGGRGNFAELITSPDDLRDYASRVAVEFESFLVEPVITGVEHRVLVKDGRPLAHIQKTPPTLAGDGARSWRQLLEIANAALEGTGVSPSPTSLLTGAGVDPDAISTPGQHLALAGRRNLHAAGAAEMVSDDPPAGLAALACAAVTALGLRVGAVDMFDTSPGAELQDLVVIEVNANPGLLSLEDAGRHDIIERLWIEMLNDCLG